jgi:dTDP-4-amino-4,6-dideoxygalactose transaminase
MSDKLAVFGGEPVIKAGTIKKWPPVDMTDAKFVMESLAGENHAFGWNCHHFQQEFAAWNGNKHAILANSGTAALHMCIAACGVGCGDHVLVPAYSWSSSATCIIHHNAIPIFVDIDFDTINIDVNKIEQAITPRTKAIIVVHLHGLSVNMDAVLKIAKKHNLRVIEDACQAHGATYNGKRVGTMGDCGAFSMNQNKLHCTGEGGVFVTNDDDIKDKAVQLWNFGENKTPSEKRDFHAYGLGWMYRSNDLTAAFGRAQLAKLNGFIDQLAANAAVLNQRLKSVNGLILPTVPKLHTHNWYNYTMRLDMKKLGWAGDPARMRDALMKAIVAEGVGVGVWQNFILPYMTVFRAKNAYGQGCPWECRGAGDGVEYDPAKFPVAQKHTDEHFGMTMPIRPPNGTDVAEQVAAGIVKVFDSIQKIDPDKVLAETK